MKLLKMSLMGLSVGLLASVTLLYADPGDGIDDATAPKNNGVVNNQMSLPDMIAHAGELDKAVKIDLRHVKHLQEVSRKDKDIIKLTCVNDKLISLKAQANIFDDTRRELEGANPDGTERVAVFTRVTEAADGAHKLRNEADGCVGEQELGTESLNGVDHPPFADDPTLGDPFNEQIEPPAYASPYN